MKSLLLPVDGSEVAERALPVAVSLALRSGAEVTALMVTSPRATATDHDECLRRATDRFPTAVLCRPVVAQSDDQVAMVILDEAAAVPDPVIVMGTHGRTAFGELLLGSVADNVIRDATVPVVLVGPHCGPAADLGGRFVVAVDGSARDEALVEAAARWAAATGSSAIAVHVAVPSSLDAGVAIAMDDRLAHDAAEAMRRRGCLASDATIVAANGASGVLEYATDHVATAILVGHRRHGRGGRLLLGSQALAIVRHARCPVVVIPC